MLLSYTLPYFMGKEGESRFNVKLRFEAIYGNIREANRGSAFLFSTEASLEQAGSKQRETDL